MLGGLDMREAQVYIKTNKKKHYKTETNWGGGWRLSTVGGGASLLALMWV